MAKKYKPRRRLQYSSKKQFKGSYPSSFFDEDYFLHGKGGNYGIKDEDGNEIVFKYDERYLDKRRDFVKTFVLDPEWKWIRKVLVLGCARGYMVQAFREHGVEAYGVDISEWAIDNCYPGIEDYLYVGDICDLSRWKNKEFDAVFALDILEHIAVPDVYKAIEEIIRVGKVSFIDVPVGTNDSNPKSGKQSDESHQSIYTQEWWITQFLTRGQAVSDILPYYFPQENPNSPWPVAEDGKKHDKAVTLIFKDPVEAITADQIEQVIIAPDSKEFKILWMSNGPWTPTGYGVGTKGVIYPLSQWYDVGVLAYYGLEGSAMRFTDPSGKYPNAKPIIYPKLFDRFGADACKLISINWRPDVLVTLFDIWIGETALSGREGDWLRKLHKYWVAYIPVDHDPCPRPILNQARQANRVVSMSLFGKAALQKEGLHSTYIPHGVNTNVFIPTSDKERAVKTLLDYTKPLINERKVDWHTDDFIIGINAANKDTRRKGYDKMFHAISHFVNQNPDARKDLRVHVHTYTTFPGGMPIEHLAEVFGIGDLIRSTHQWHMYTAVTEANMAKLYQSYDILFNLSKNEGFGIPLIEAGACGVPAIATRFTSMPELVEGHGWLVEPVTYDVDPLMSNTANPNVYEASEYLEQAYNHPDEVRRLGDKARVFSLNYDWDNVVVPLWVNLIEDIREELYPQSLGERRIM